MKANFIDINHIFFQRKKKLQRTWFFHLFGLLPCKNRSKNSTTHWGFRLETRRRFASRHFFFGTQLHSSIVMYAEPCWKRPLLRPEKSSEGTLYSVPSFGGHIAISHDVTTYPFLAMARTVLVSQLVEHLFSAIKTSDLNKVVCPRGNVSNFHVYLKNSIECRRT